MVNGVFEEVKEFLEHIIKMGRDKHKKSWKFLKRKFGEKKYERMYDFCVERGYIGSLPYGEGKEKDHHTYVKTNGFAFLEEQKRITLQQNQIDSQNFLTLGILTFAIFSGIITFVYYFLDLRGRNIPFASGAMALTGLILIITIFIGIIKLRPKKV